MKSLMTLLLIISISIFSISCASHPPKNVTTVEIGQTMLDLPAVPRPTYEKMVRGEAITSETNSEIFVRNNTLLKDWAEQLYIKYEAIREQVRRIKELRAQPTPTP